MKPLWHIALFAGLEARREGAPVYRPQIRKSGALLAYLAYCPDRFHSRAELACRFWPDATTEAARGNLRAAICELRRHLDAPETPVSASAIAGDGDGLRLNADLVETDVGLYRQATRQAGRAQTDGARLALLERAAALYQGPLLPSLDAEWADRGRDLLANMQQDTLAQLIVLHTEESRPEEAVRCAQQAVALNNLDETACCHLMRLYLAQGRHADALTQYERLKRALAREIGLPPPPEARELAQQARRGRLQNAAARGAAVRVSGRNRSGDAPAGAKMPRVPLLPPATPKRRSGDVWAGAETPALRASNLPVPLTCFVDREDELRRCHPLLTRPGARLLTLTGPGGTGKTRLAIEVARHAADAFAGRAYWTELAPLADANRILEAVADAVLTHRRTDMDALRQLRQDAGDARLLLVLDNFEHLADAGGSVVTALLRALPGLTILVTSRRLLRVEGEQAFAVPPLALAPSVALFVDRAGLARPDWTLTPADHATVAALCARLEGIPLALELAAAWMDTLAPAQILERLNQRFTFLVSPRQDIPDRHRSLYAVLDWSYRQLAPTLQKTFLRLSVFRGGWTLDAAQAVCQQKATSGEGSEREKQRRQEGREEEGREEIADALRQLLDRSLIQIGAAQEGNGPLRYTMLESLREFALAQSADAERHAADDAHSAYFLHLAESADPRLRGAEQIAWLDRLEADHDNLRAALRHLHDTQNAPASWRLSAALCRLWQMRGHVREGREHFARALALYGEPTLARVYALRCAGLLASDQDDIAVARPLLEQSLALARRLADTGGVAWALYSLGHIAHVQGDNASAISLLKEALAVFGTLAEPRGIASALHKIGSALMAQGLHEEAMPYFERAAERFGQLGDRQNRAVSLLNIGNVYAWREDSARATACHEESLAAFKAVGNEWLAGVARISLGCLAAIEQSYDTADELLTRALAAHRRHGARTHEAWTLYHLGLLAWLRNDRLLARRHYGACLDALPSPGHSVRHASVLFGLARLAQDAGQAERAACLLGAGSAQVGDNAALLVPFMRRHYETLQAETACALGAARFAAFRSQGQAFTWEQAVEYALRDS